MQLHIIFSNFLEEKICAPSVNHNKTSFLYGYICFAFTFVLCKGQLKGLIQFGRRCYVNLYDVKMLSFFK